MRKQMQGKTDAKKADAKESRRKAAGLERHEET